MDTAIATFQADTKAAFTPELGKIKPVDIFWLEPWVIDETTVTNLGRALAPGEDYLHPPAVRDEGDGRFRLIQGLNRVEAWKRCRGEHTPMPVIIYPPHTPDERIELLKLEENLFRTELSAAERTTKEMRWVALSKKLSGGHLVTPVSQTAEAAESGNPTPISTRARGGRGNKGMALQVADKFGIGKRAVNMRRQSAAAVIGETIDLDRDTPEELERKADELEKADQRQRAEPKVVQSKRRKPGLHVEDTTPPSEPNTGETSSKIKALWKAFNAIGRKHQLRFIHDVCLHVGLDPLMMASPAVFGMAEAEPDPALALPAEAFPATDDAALDEQAEQRDDAEDIGADDLQDADDVSKAADQEPNGANLDADHLQDAGKGVSEVADEEAGGATKCGYCKHPFGSLDQRYLINGQLYHDGFCLDYAKRIATAAA